MGLVGRLSTADSIVRGYCSPMEANRPTPAEPSWAPPKNKAVYLRLTSVSKASQGRASAKIEHFGCVDQELLVSIASLRWNRRRLERSRHTNGAWPLLERRPGSTGHEPRRRYVICPSYPGCESKFAKLSRTVAVEGWSGPSACSRIASALKGVKSRCEKHCGGSPLSCRLTGSVAVHLVSSQIPDARSRAFCSTPIPQA